MNFSSLRSFRTTDAYSFAAAISLRLDRFSGLSGRTRRRPVFRCAWGNSDQNNLYASLYSSFFSPSPSLSPSNADFCRTGSILVSSLVVFGLIFLQLIISITLFSRMAIRFSLGSSCAERRFLHIFHSMHDICRICAICSSAYPKPPPGMQMTPVSHRAGQCEEVYEHAANERRFLPDRPSNHLSCTVSPRFSTPPITPRLLISPVAFTPLRLCVFPALVLP